MLFNALREFVNTTAVGPQDVVELTGDEMVLGRRGVPINRTRITTLLVNK